MFSLLAPVIYHHSVSLVACSLCAASATPLLDESVGDDFSLISFTREAVLSHAVYLSQLLKYESIFVAVSLSVRRVHSINQLLVSSSSSPSPLLQPCDKLEDELSYAFESLISSELIVSPHQEDLFNEEAQQWTSRIVRRAMYSLNEDGAAADNFTATEETFSVRRRCIKNVLTLAWPQQLGVCGCTSWPGRPHITGCEKRLGFPSGT